MLPTDYPLKKAVRIYLKRLAPFFFTLPISLLVIPVLYVIAPLSWGWVFAPLGITLLITTSLLYRFSDEKEIKEILKNIITKIAIFLGMISVMLSFIWIVVHSSSMREISTTIAFLVFCLTLVTALSISRSDEKPASKVTNSLMDTIHAIMNFFGFNKRR